MSQLARRGLFGLLVAGTGALAVSQWRGPNGWEEIKRRQQRISELHAKIHELETQNNSIDKKIKDLDKPGGLELEMRRIEMLQEGEVQFRVEEPTPDAPAQAR